MATFGKLAVTALSVVFVTALPQQRGVLSTATSCESLPSLTLPHTSIMLAQVVPAGGFSRQPTGASAAEQGFSNPVAFCRVAATLRPSSDSDIKVEVWLPATGWNGKFQAVGNGGWGGTMSYPAMSNALSLGYATSGTDTGHAGGGVGAGAAAFALGHPEKLIDYAYRSEHEMTVLGKVIVEAFYGVAPKHSYFNGCSTGGRQALMEAERFPADFDGIIAGAAANPKTHLDAWRISLAQAMFTGETSAIPTSKFPMIHAAVLGTCDLLDGLRDGLIEDPARCHFDPGSLLCQGADGPSCLTARQVAVAAQIMSPLRDGTTGAELFPGFEAGTELGWAEMLRGPGPLEMAVDQYKFMIFKDPSWDWRTFDVVRDMALAEKAMAGTLSAVSPDLTAFVRRGGKLLMYHGWSDQAVPPRASINYYTHALAVTTGPNNPSWARLFMVPGMGHCRGGEGPNTFDMVAALDPWVENGKTPERILASQTIENFQRTRPLCAYPQVARYVGIGDPNNAASFACEAP